jgi:hypothetical protein
MARPDSSVILGRGVGLVVGLMVLAFAGLAAGILFAYMTESGWQRLVAVAAIAVAGACAAVVVYLFVTWVCKSKPRSLAIQALLAALFIVPILSMFYPGRITHARFGLTVYGLIPVPSLDITVRSNGVLWFRDKSHDMSLEEVTALLPADTDVVIIGTGWHGAMRVAPAIQAIEDIEGIAVHTLRTPEAFELFNQLRSAGRRVVLIAHSTC